jgi:hypothetical protein
MVAWLTWTRLRRGAGSTAGTDKSGTCAGRAKTITARSRSASLSTSVLGAAGFTQIGTVWQHGENRILAAVRAP